MEPTSQKYKLNYNYIYYYRTLKIYIVKQEKDPYVTFVRESEVIISKIVDPFNCKKREFSNTAKEQILN